MGQSALNGGLPDGLHRAGNGAKSISYPSHKHISGIIPVGHGNDSGSRIRSIFRTLMNYTNVLTGDKISNVEMAAIITLISVCTSSFASAVFTSLVFLIQRNFIG